MNNLHDSLKKETIRLKSLGYNVVPTRHKAPLFSINTDEFEQYDGSYRPGQTGIAIVCSKESGVLALDLDVDDRSLFELILSIAPSNVIKVGGKGATIFYQMPDIIQSKEAFGYNIVNPDEKERLEKPYVLKGVLDLLANNTITIMPPSQHFSKGVATGKYYKWLDAELPKQDFLPTIDENKINSIREMLNKYCVERDESGALSSTKYSGRNDRLKAVITSIYHREKTSLPATELKSFILDEVFEQDKKENINNRLFLDEQYRNPKNEAEAKGAAFKMVSSIVSMLVKAEECNALPTKKSSEVLVEKFEYKDYPKASGVLEAIQNYILEGSRIHSPNMALGAALSVVGTIIGNKVSFNKSLANNYYILLSDAGGGKSSVIKGIKNNDILPDEFFYPGSFSSSQAVIKAVFDNCEVLCTNDELSKLLKQIKNGNEWQQGIVQELASIWSASGSRYELQAQSHKTDEERKNAKKFIVNPYMSFLGATTFTEFMENVDSDMFDSGMFPRCLFFIDKERPNTRRLFLDDEEIEKSRDLAMKFVTELSSMIKNFLSKNVSVKAALGYNFEEIEPAMRVDIKPSQELIDRLLEINREIMSMRGATDRSHLKAMLDRGIEHVNKLAMIAAFSELNTVILHRHLDWAFELYKTSLHNADPTFNIAASAGYDDRLVNKALALIKKEGKISKRDLTNKLKLKTKLTQQLLEDLLSRGYVDKVESKSISGRSRVLFFAKTDTSEE